MKWNFLAVITFFLALVAILFASQAQASEQPQKLYCSIGQQTEYFATFDSGKSDKLYCDTTAKFWEGFQRELYKTPKIKCWCSAATTV